MSSIKKIYHRSIAGLFYLFIKSGLLFVRIFGIAGYKHSTVGTCTILAPPKQMLVILEGITYLQEIDLEMYKRLTAERKYVFYYHKTRIVSAFEFTSITDNSFNYGKESVAIYLVQTILFRVMKDSFSGERFRNDSLEVIAMRCDHKQQIFEFVKKHSFSPKLVEHFQKSAERARDLKNQQGGNQ